MTISQKISEIVTKYGLNYRGYIFASLIFPPAGMYVGWKMPGASRFLRTVLAILPAVGPVALSAELLLLIGRNIGGLIEYL